MQEKEILSTKESVKNNADMDYLLKTNAEIFNVTPPNQKGKDIKSLGKYKLMLENSSNKAWKGFTPSKIEYTEETYWTGYKKSFG